MEAKAHPNMSPIDDGRTPTERHAAIESLLARRAAGDTQALEALWREIYSEVHRLAHSMLSREGVRKPVDTTVLVHEVYLKMGDATFENRSHLFGSLVRMMGQIVTDAARRAVRERRAGERLAHGLSLDTPALGLPSDSAGDLSARVIACLEQLDRIAPRAAAVAWLRFVGGLTVEQVARCLDISERSVKSDWAFARAWMHRELASPGRSAPGAAESRSETPKEPGS